MNMHVLVDKSLFTNMQWKLVHMLLDGQAHSYEDLKLEAGDELMNNPDLSRHITNVRKKLAPYGLDVICVWQNRKRQYRMIRPIVTS